MNQNSENRRVLLIDDYPSIHHDYKQILLRSTGDSSLSAMTAALFGEPTTTALDIPFEVTSLQLQSLHHTAPVEVRTVPKVDTAAAAAPKQPRRILVADDCEANRIIAHKGLTRLGYNCELVCNGKEAVDAVQCGDFDLVLMDCQMPVMDGLEATRVIRASEPDDGRRICIVALTASAFDGQRERCVAAGMDGLLSKPLDFSTLVETIEGFLSTSSPERATPSRASDAETDFPPLDLDGLYKRCMNDADFVEIMLGSFQKHVQNDFDALAAAVETRDLDRTLKKAHSFQGLASNVGALQLRHIANTLEDTARKSDFELTDQCLTSLRDELDRCFNYLPQATQRLAEIQA